MSFRNHRKPRTHHTDLGTPSFLFTPADSPPPGYSPPPPNLNSSKSKSSPSLNATNFNTSSSSASNQAYHRYRGRTSHGRTSVAVVSSETETEDDDDDQQDDENDVVNAQDAGVGILHARFMRDGVPGGGGLRVRSSYAPSSRRVEKVKPICTAPGALCAGETETEVDEPPRHLPTSRIIHPSSSSSCGHTLSPSTSLQNRLIPFLFEFSRLLSIVPAVFGTLYNSYRVFQPPSPPTGVDDSWKGYTPERVDFAIAALWAILTGYQCLAMTTGLLVRWRLYYPPLPTLIRLLALQGICWPATQLTCTILEWGKRPVVVWAVIGTTTCVSRGVQIWVTSNLWLTGGGGGGGGRGDNTVEGEGEGDEEGLMKKWTKRWGGGKWGGRRWDWSVVGVKCVLPAGIVYFVMAWAEQLRREFW